MTAGGGAAGPPEDGGPAADPVAVCFVLPTYNEAANIEALLERLTALHPEDGSAFLVVDDRSPDGTGGLVRAFAGRDPRVRLLEGPRRGLGAAYARGLAWCLEALDPAVVVCMDADFQHDPADARRLLASVEAGADVAIGSRYVPGGAVDRRWGRRRRWLSAWGNRLARGLAGMGGVRDCTSGYRAVRAGALHAADAGGVRERGYAYQIALLHRLLRAGARVEEVPILFRRRARGAPKLAARDLAGFAWCVLRLRLGR